MDLLGSPGVQLHTVVRCQDWVQMGAGQGLGPFKMLWTPKGQTASAGCGNSKPVRRVEVVTVGVVRCGTVELVVKTLEPDGSRRNPGAATQLNDCGQFT